MSSEAVPSRILVVEREPEKSGSLTQRLAGLGDRLLVPVAESSFADALERLLREQHDALVLDLTSPASGGIAALRSLKEQPVDVPVVVIADDDGDLIFDAMRSGAQDFLVKSGLTADALRRTLRHAIERHRVELQLHRSSRLQAIGQLAGGVAHDFNNIILAIQSSCELLLEKTDAASEDAEVINEIRASASRGAALIRQLLAFTRQQVLKPRVIDLATTVRETSHLLTRIIGEDVELDIVAENGCTVRADSGQIQQVLMNLAANSRDAMPRQGKLEIETRRVELDATFAASHRPQPPGSYVLLSVRDTGSGMDDITRRRLFEPFFSTKAEGSGLGLATTYGIVKQTGGYIWVSSRPGKGTIVDLYFPHVDGEAEPQPPQPDHDAPSGAEGETILLVEDDPVVRRLTKRALARQGYEVIVAENGPRALELFESAEQTIDLVITDVVMPRLSGPALAQKLRQRRPELKVLYISGYPTESVMRHGLLDPAKNFLEKPFSRDTLLKKVRQTLNMASDETA